MQCRKKILLRILGSVQACEGERMGWMGMMTGEEENKAKSPFQIRGSKLTKHSLTLLYSLGRQVPEWWLTTSRSSRSRGVLARTVTAGHPNYCNFGIVRNHPNSIRSIFERRWRWQQVISGFIAPLSLQYLNVSYGHKVHSRASITPSQLVKLSCNTQSHFPNSLRLPTFSRSSVLLPSKGKLKPLNIKSLPKKNARDYGSHRFYCDFYLFQRDLGRSIPCIEWGHFD